jgi:hypothetical protein
LLDDTHPYMEIATGDYPASAAQQSLREILTLRVFPNRDYIFDAATRDRIVQIYLNHLRAIAAGAAPAGGAGAPAGGAGAPAGGAGAPAAPAYAAPAAPAAPAGPSIAGARDLGILKAYKTGKEGKLLIQMDYNFSLSTNTNSIVLEEFNSGDRLVVLERERYGFVHVFKESTIANWFATEATQRRPPTNPNNRKVLTQAEIEVFTLEIVPGKPPSTSGGTSYKRYKHTISRKKLRGHRKTQRGKNKRMRLKRK